MHHSVDWSTIVDKAGTIVLALLALYRSERASRKATRALALCSYPECPLKKHAPELERERN